MEMRRQIFMFNSNNEIELVSNDEGILFLGIKNILTEYIGDCIIENAKAGDINQVQLWAIQMDYVTNCIRLNEMIELAKNNHFYFKDSEQLEYKINLRGAIKED